MENARVYADLTFLVNLIMDLLILWAAGKLAGARLVYTRLFITAAVGGMYAVGNLFPALAVFYTLPAKIIFSVLLVIGALRPQGLEEFKKALLYFYGLSFAAAGATIAASFLWAGNNGELSYVWLPAGILLLLATGYYGARYLQKTVIPDLLHFEVKIRFGEETCSGQGFLDTGNSLKDPVTNRPVVVAEYQFMKNFLPADLRQVMENINKEGEDLDALGLTSWSHRLRLIPFTSIGKKNGLLIGVRSDELLLLAGKKHLRHPNLVIGLYRDVLSTEGNYQMLIPAEILQKG